MDINDVIDLIKEGETEKVEFKSKVTSGIGEEICALANALGGCILIGIRDDGNIIGCDPEQSKQMVSDHANNIIPPLNITFDISPINEKMVLAITIPQSKILCSIGGMAFIRIGTSKRPLSMQEIFTIGAENLLYHIDRTRTDQMDVDGSLVQEFQTSARTKVLNMEKYMLRTGALTTDGHLTLAGLLLFHDDPEPLVPHASIRLIDEDGNWKRYSGSFMRTIPLIEKDLRSRFNYYPIHVGFVRKDIPEYPIAAVREGIVNAVTHRNYAIMSEVFIEIKKDRLLIRNPGSFPPGTTPENPLPVPRNPVLYELMYQCGLVERQGRGIDLIRDECKEHPFVEFSYDIKPNYTILSFIRTRSHLTKEQMDVISVLSTEELSSSEMAHRLATTKSTVVKRLNGLIDLGIVERIGTGPSTRYRMKR